MLWCGLESEDARESHVVCGCWILILVTSLEFEYRVGVDGGEGKDVLRSRSLDCALMKEMGKDEVYAFTIECPHYCFPL